MSFRNGEPLAERFPAEDGAIGFRDGRLHTLRHFFCSQCANQCIPERVVMRWLGHRDSRIVNRYYHLCDQKSRRQMSRLELFDDADGDGAVGAEHDPI